MTIQELIDRLSDIGQEIGHKSEVHVWNLASKGGTDPLAVLKAKSAEIGRIGKTTTRIACINVSP
jgi:hypothetical protein